MKDEADLPQELPTNFHLEGPILYSRAGSNEVKSGFFGTGGCFLLMGGKWNVVDDFMDLTHYTVSVMGCMVSLSAGQDTVLRLYLRSGEEVEKWSQLIKSSSYLRVSDEYIAKLKQHVQKQCKAQRSRSLAAAFGALTESICAPKPTRTSVMEQQAKLNRSLSMRMLEGADETYVGRFYLKSAWTEGNGRIYIHGDALILESLKRGEMTLISIPLTGVTCTTASFMISVRGSNGLALLRLWVDNAEEAEQLAQKIIATGKTSTEMVQRKILPSTSTARRQLGRAAESLCNCTMQAPQKFRNNLVPKGLSCWQRPQKKRPEKSAAAYALDGRCAILRAKTTDVQAVHCTLRGDALWFGVKAGACDQVMSVVGATASATENMVMIKARNGEMHRLWPELGSGSPQQWRDAIKAAGQLAKDLGKWDAMKRSVFHQEVAHEKGREVARSRRFRIAANCITSSFGAMAGFVCPERHSATEAILKWQAASVLPREVVSNQEAYPSCTANFFRRTDGGKAQPRTLEIRGDVMFVFNEKGQMEKPVMLEGANIFVNLDKYPVVSIWIEGVMQARMFMQTQEEAESWGKALEKASKLSVAEAQAPTAAPEKEATESNLQTLQRSMSLSSNTAVKAPKKLSSEEHVASQKLAKARSRRFIEPSPADMPEQAVGA